MAKKNDKVEHVDEATGVEIKVTHEPDGPWHALVKLVDDGQRKKNLNFVEDTAEDLIAQVDAVVAAMDQTKAKINELVATQEQAQAPAPPEQEGFV